MDGSDIREMVAAIAETMEANRDELCRLDGVIGDADHGIAMALGFGAARDAAAALEPGAEPTAVLNAAAKAFLNAVGASSGPLYATALMRAGAAVKGEAAHALGVEARTRPSLSRCSGRHSRCARRGSGAVWPCGEVLEDLADHRRIEQEGDDAHPTAAFGTGERIHLVDASNQLCPGWAQAPSLGGSRRGRLGLERGGWVCGTLRSTGAGEVGVVPVVANLVQPRLGHVLQEPGEKLRTGARDRPLPRTSAHVCR